VRNTFLGGAYSVVRIIQHARKDSVRRVNSLFDKLVAGKTPNLRDLIESWTTKE
jgi:hypothetical protein